MPEKFNLVNYTNHIMQLAAANDNMTVETALQCFIANLATMKEHYKGCPDLNYHVLGQQWNQLLSAEKVTQRGETLARLKKYNRSGGRS